jgi:uncharacterized protein YegJ (DUF2314 family)
MGFLTRRSITAAILLGLVATSCKKRPPAPKESAVTVVSRDAGTIAAEQPPPAGPLVAERFMFVFAVYHLPAPRADPLRELKKLLRGKPIALVDAGADTKLAGSTVEVFRPPIGEYPPPDADRLKYSAKGLSDSDKDRLAESRAVTVLSFAGPGDRAVETNRLALALVRDLIAKVGGLAWDEDTREMFGQEKWAKRALAFNDQIPDVTSHVAIHQYRDGELFRLVTIGMGKFAMPDVSVNNVTAGDADRMGDTVNLVCQTMLERGRLDEPGSLAVSLDGIQHPAVRRAIDTDVMPNAKRQASLVLADVKPEEGDADNRLFEIVFPGPAISLQERHDAVLLELYGAPEEEVIEFEKHDPEMLAASKRAKKAAFRLRGRYADGPPFGERLMVKAPFKTPSDNNEWMWLEVVRWKGGTIDGILQNDPVEVPDLKSGARVEVQADAIFDYLLVKADGSQEGNETGKLLLQRKSREK